MLKEEKIAKIRGECCATNPGLAAGQPIMLRHIVQAFRVKKLKYWVGSAGYFIEPVSLTATNARWQALENELTKQDDACIDFLYQVLAAGADGV